jgi:pilus assembly protein CpaB
MRGKSMMLILVAVGCGLVASVGISQVMEQNSNGAGREDTVPILVALEDINIDDKLDSKNVGLEQWPKNRVPAGAFQDIEKIKDHFARARMTKGEVIQPIRISDRPGDSITRRMPTGFRAVTIRADEEVRDSNLLGPGDKVDVLFRPTHNSWKGTYAAKSLLRNVRVGALNAVMERSTEGDEEKTSTAKTVTLYIKQEQVSLVESARALGELKLVLRATGEPGEEDQIGDVTMSELENRGEQAATAASPIANLLNPEVTKPKVDEMPSPEMHKKFTTYIMGNSGTVMVQTDDSGAMPVVTPGAAPIGGGGSSAAGGLPPTVPTMPDPTAGQAGSQ